MRKYIHLYALLLLCAIGASCTAQNQTEASPQQKEKPVVQSSSQTDTDPAEHDPAFVESSWITAKHGPQSITRNTLQDRNGTIWLSTWEGIMSYDGKEFTNWTNKEGLRRFHVFDILEDSQGNLWFSTIGAGVYRYDSEGFTNFSTAEGLVNDRVLCFYEDNSGKIWIGTEKGISVYDGRTFQNFTKEDGLIDEDVNTILQDENGRFWIACRGEASFYDGKSFSQITNDQGQAFTNARKLIKDSKGNIWIGGNNGLWRYDGNTYVQLSKNFVGYIYEDRAGNIWTSSQSPEDRLKWQLHRYSSTIMPFQTPSPTLIHSEEGMLFGIYEDKDSNIWFGSLAGVGRYDGVNIERFEE